MTRGEAVVIQGWGDEGGDDGGDGGGNGGVDEGGDGGVDVGVDGVDALYTTASTGHFVTNARNIHCTLNIRGLNHYTVHYTTLYTPEGKD